MWYTQRLDPILDRMFQGIVLIIPNDCPPETGRAFLLPEAVPPRGWTGVSAAKGQIGGVIKTIHID
jgi:hypothetical protein